MIPGQSDQGLMHENTDLREAEMPSSMNLRGAALVSAFLLALSGCGSKSPPETNKAAASPESAETAASTAKPAAGVNGAVIAAAASNPDTWLSYGRGYDEQRFSPLDSINENNVGELGLAWTFDIDYNRGQEATPIVVDGVMYATGAWSIVYALDAVTGKLLWKHDPEVPRQVAQHGCCDVANRGVAVWEGKVVFGTYDGRLQALDAATGKVLWSVATVDQSQPYTISGAPRIVKGKVLIGNGGAEFGVRGYISAYDVNSGEMLWRFYTVPGNPADGFESKAMEMAAATWKGEWWKLGGGGTVWDSMAYDPELDLLYIGVGNGSPWNQRIRSPGGGDNLFLSSIVALKPDTGEYVWHYQTTPGETWDYTATQHIMLADLEIDGKKRKVLMQAPKNGFFYVLDRATGELLSAEKFSKVTWASHVDMATGRPVETENARYEKGAQLIFPANQGAHNWHPMSFNPKTGLVYIPAQEIPQVYAEEKKYQVRPGLMNLGVDPMVLAFPTDEAELKGVLGMIKGYLLAWDPVAQKEVWRHEHPGASNGGTLSTAGNLVFQGNTMGDFQAFRATDGEALWRAPAGSGVVAAPMTYSVDGVQYVTVLAGWGGAYPLVMGEAGVQQGRVGTVSRVLTFKLGGTASLPPGGVPAERRPEPPELTASADVIAEGRMLFFNNCMVCHGIEAVSGSTIPDLRYMDTATHAAFPGIVMGARADKGMPSFAQYLKMDDINAIHAYLVERANVELERLSKASE
jgi:PQQ-dependent dehydrogenase (methanol/ethanol family)